MHTYDGVSVIKKKERTVFAATRTDAEIITLREADLCSVTESWSDSLWPMSAACQAPLSMGFSRQESWSALPCPPPGDLLNPGIKPRSSMLQEGSLLAEPQGKARSTGVDSLSLLQGIFLTQESNQGLLHCRLILYQLSYEGTLKVEWETRFLKRRSITVEVRKCRSVSEES